MTTTERKPAALNGQLPAGYPMRGRRKDLIEKAERLEEIAGELREMAACKHGPDFRSVVWFGSPYWFTALQAAVVKQLWEAWEHGTPEIGAETLLENAGADREISRLDTLFRGCAAWKKMIVAGRTRGAYCLKEPDCGRGAPRGTGYRRTDKTTKEESEVPHACNGQARNP